MVFLAAQIRRIEAALRARMPGGLLVCAMCHSNRLTLANGYARISLQVKLSENMLDAPGLPSVCLVCQNCGYTHLFNVIVLGLTDLGPADWDRP